MNTLSDKDRLRLQKEQKNAQQFEMMKQAAVVNK
jgi:hypothetical protein